MTLTIDGETKNGGSSDRVGGMVGRGVGRRVGMFVGLGVGSI